MGTAQTGRTHGCTDQCCIRSRKSLPTRSRPHMGVKRTWLFALHMSAYDPKRTLDLGLTRQFRGVKNPHCLSGIGQTRRGPSGNVRNRHCSLGTLMPAEDRHFSRETVRSMQVALDLAWSSLSPEEQAQSSRTLLATRILDAAEAGERSPARLVMLARMSASGP